MNYFEGVFFFIALFIVLGIGIVLNILGKRLDYYIFLVSLLFLVVIYGKSYSSFSYLTIFLIFEYLLMKLAEKNLENKKIIKLLIVCSLLPLIINKIFSITNLGIMGFLGISYMSFKSIQILIEIHDGLIKKVRLIDYLQFMIFFPTISSGPIDRSRRFLENLNDKIAKNEYYELLGTGIFRFLLGFAYKIVFSTALYAGLTSISNVRPITHIFMYMYLYTFYLFFDFAGYSLMAVGVSNMLGIKTPMNFKYPFLSIDIKDFWNRWHITLSTWLRDFVFMRIYMFNSKKKIFKSRVNSAMSAYFINMFLMGLWHGISVYYLIYGAYHGILMAGYELYQKKSKFYKKNKNKNWYKVLSWFITMQLVIIGLFIFSGHFWQLVKRL